MRDGPLRGVFFAVLFEALAALAFFVLAPDCYCNGDPAERSDP